MSFRNTKIAMLLTYYIITIIYCDNNMRTSPSASHIYSSLSSLSSLSSPSSPSSPSASPSSSSSSLYSMSPRISVKRCVERYNSTDTHSKSMPLLTTNYKIILNDKYKRRQYLRKREDRYLM